MYPHLVHPDTKPTTSNNLITSSIGPIYSLYLLKKEYTNSHPPRKNLSIQNKILSNTSAPSKKRIHNLNLQKKTPRTRMYGRERKEAAEGGNMI